MADREKDWMISFVRRYQEILIAWKPKLLTKSRSEGLSEEVINMFCSMLEPEIRENKIELENIYNLGEVGHNTDP